jgi:glycosyltransferase involved in cell wall biosynthesis
MISNDFIMKKDLSICIVTSGIKGPIRFGGIATAFHNLSIVMAEAGCDVSVLYVNHPTYYTEDLEYWQKYYAGYGVKLIPLDKSAELYGTQEMQESYFVYKYLAGHEKFDVVIFHDLKGTAYYSLLARKLQKNFRDTFFIINSHASTKLSDYFNARPAQDRNILAKYFLESSSLEMADLVVSPSQFYLDWMEKNNINLNPSRKLVIQNTVFPEPPDPVSYTLKKTGGNYHFCFFSRLDALKGIFVFIEAFDKFFRENPGRAKNVGISFIGDPVEINRTSSLDIIKEMTAGWPVKPHFEADLTTPEALDYLKKNDGIVISSTLGETSSYIILECLSYGIPTLASDLPNIRELIREDFHASHLFRAGDPDDLLRLVNHVMDNGIELPVLKHSLESTRKDWIALMDRLALAKADTAPEMNAKLPSPLVSIIIPTYNRRSAELGETIDSLIEQDYRNMEIIIAHDGALDVSDQLALQEISGKVKNAGIPFSIEYREKSYKPQVCNQAAAVAKGKYLCFFDDDDIAKPDMISEFVRAAELTGSDMVTDFAQNFSVDNETGTAVPWCRDRVVMQNVSLSLGNSINVGFYQHFFGKANIFLKKEVYDEVGGMTVSDIKTPYIDWDLYVKVALAGYSIEVIPDELYYYRMHSNESIYYSTHSLERFDSYINRYHGHLKILEAYNKKYPGIADLLELAHFHLSVPKVMDQPSPANGQNTNKTFREKKSKTKKGIVTKLYFIFGINKSSLLRKMLNRSGEILSKIGADFKYLSSLDK